MSGLNDTQEHIKETILHLEQKYPVDIWTINGIHVWPYIRIKIYLNMLVYSDATNNSVPNIHSNRKKSISVFKKFATLFKISFAFFRLQFFFASLKKKKAVLFGSHFHRVMYNGKYFNRIYDSIIDFHSLHKAVYMMEYNIVSKPIYNKRAVIQLTKRLNEYKLLLKLKRNKRRIVDLSLIQFSEFYDELGILDLKVESLKVSENDLIKWAIKINNLEDFFFRFYKKTEPSKIVFLGYYGYDDLYAALIAANKMNISTVDFQHGPQTNIHMAYSSWLKVPKSGFNTMPIEFWTWDNKSRENIEKWSIKTKKIKVSVLGQPYIAFSLANKSFKRLEGQNILYTLQVEPIPQLGPKIIGLIKGSQYNWNLRLHPRSVTNEQDLILYLNNSGLLNKFKIQNPVNNPLPDSLANTILHITNFSGCLIEAHIMGVPTLIINNVGKEMFVNYIDNELVYYINESEKDFDLKYLSLLEKIKTTDQETNYSEIPNPFL